MCLVASYLSKVSNSKYPANCTLLEMIWYHQPVWPSLKMYESVPWGKPVKVAFRTPNVGGKKVNTYIHGAKTPPQEHPFTTLLLLRLQCRLSLLSSTSGSQTPTAHSKLGTGVHRGGCARLGPGGLKSKLFLGMLPHLIDLLVSLVPGFLPSPFPCSWLQSCPSVLCLPDQGVSPC